MEVRQERKAHSGGWIPTLPAKCSAYAASQASATLPSGNFSLKRAGSSAIAKTAWRREEMVLISCNQSRRFRPKSPIESDRSAISLRVPGRPFVFTGVRLLILRPLLPLRALHRVGKICRVSLQRLPPNLSASFRRGIEYPHSRQHSQAAEDDRPEVSSPRDTQRWERKPGGLRRIRFVAARVWPPFRPRIA